MGGLLQFGQGLGQVVGGGGFVMPVHAVFHKTHTFAFGGVGHQHRGLTGNPRLAGERAGQRTRQRVGQCRMVMAVHLTHGPAKGAQLVAQWLKAQGIGSISLNPDTVIDTWKLLAN